MTSHVLHGKTKAQRSALGTYIGAARAFAASFLPAIDSVDKSGAKLIRDQLYNIASNPTVDFVAINEIVRASFSKLGIDGWYVNNMVNNNLVAKVNYPTPSNMEESTDTSS